MGSENQRARAVRRLQELAKAAGPLQSGVLAIGKDLEEAPASSVARLLLGTLPQREPRAARLTALLAELQRADAATIAKKPQLQRRDG